MNKIKQAALLTFIALAFFTTAKAQDSLAAIKAFMNVCNVYKKLPLQLEVSLRNSTNLITDKEDTMQVSGRFYFQPEGSYVSFGELEQVANDSLLLLVSNELKRMIVYPNNASVTRQMQRYMGIQLNDSSAQRIAVKYTADILSLEQGLSGILLKSRSLLPHTSFPKDEIMLAYDSSSSQPVKVTQTSRRLIPLKAASFAHYRDQPEWKERLVTVGDSSYFLIREQTSTYSYNHITHIAGIKLPVLVNDRIVMAGDGKYTPVKTFGDFVLAQNL